MGLGTLFGFQGVLLFALMPCCFSEKLKIKLCFFCKFVC